VVLDGRQRRRLAITFIAIWRQLRLQRAATGYTQLTDLGRIYRDEPMVGMQYEIIKALHEGRDPAAVPPGAATYVVDFWEQVATLVRLRQIDREMLFMTLGWAPFRGGRCCDPSWTGYGPIAANQSLGSSSNGWRASWRIALGVPAMSRSTQTTFFPTSAPTTRT
jgi:hypothetical protein